MKCTWACKQTYYVPWMPVEHPAFHANAKLHIHNPTCFSYRAKRQISLWCHVWATHIALIYHWQYSLSTCWFFVFLLVLLWLLLLCSLLMLLTMVRDLKRPIAHSCGKMKRYRIRFVSACGSSTLFSLFSFTKRKPIDFLFIFLFNFLLALLGITSSGMEKSNEIRKKKKTPYWLFVLVLFLCNSICITLVGITSFGVREDRDFIFFLLPTICIEWMFLVFPM